MSKGLKWWEGIVHRHLTKALLPFWWQRDREFLLLRELTKIKRDHLEERKTLEDQLKDTENKLKTMEHFVGSMERDLARDIPSFMEQRSWECGMYELPDTQTEWYFNPGLLVQNGEKHLIARKIWQAPYAYLNGVVRFRLQNNKPVSKHPIDLPSQRYSESFEDPRVAMDDKGNWWLSAVDFIQKQTFAHQIICKLDSNFRPQQIYHPNIGKNGNSLFSNTGHEKNWLWFWHDGRPHCVYWTTPHVVYEHDWYHGVIKKHETFLEGSLWMHGEPRGGTPPVRVDDEYWTFFHSFTPWKYPRRRYHMGALAFSSKPPFAITRMTSIPLFSASSNDPVREPLPITIFACGALYEKGTWHVTFGVNDLRSGWAMIPHKDLSALTHSVKSESKTVPITASESVAA